MPSLRRILPLLPLLLCAAAAEIPWHERALVGLEVGPTGAQFGHSDTNDARDPLREAVEEGRRLDFPSSPTAWCSGAGTS